MSNLFRRIVPLAFVLQVFAVMRQAHWHTFKVLTKRSEQLLAPDDAIDWVCVGGELGPGARPLDPAWVTEVRDQCLAAGVPFFFKQ